MWSRVSKAADISKAERIVILPESMDSKISFVILRKSQWNEISDEQTVMEKNWEILKCVERYVKGQDAQGFCQWYSDWISA